VKLPDPPFAHLLAMSDAIGTFEHADHATARRAHGYCTDDVARVSVVVSREPSATATVLALGRRSLDFLEAAQNGLGEVRNRRAAGGRWESGHCVEDCWGRAVWAFGTAARRADDVPTRVRALTLFERATCRRSPWPRSMAFAALGAAEVVALDRDHDGARRFLQDVVTSIGPLGTDPDWPWPEARLAYANAVLPEALLIAGQVLDRREVLDEGLVLLRWLLDRETVGGHLSPTPVGGAGPADAGPRFDQQPIEVAAMADACARAAAVTGDAAWLAGVELAAAWFLGDNDAVSPMWDPSTGGGFDGLHVFGPNLNQGAESTLALISTLQAARLLVPAGV
jgi:hypothetical protein